MNDYKELIKLLHRNGLSNGAVLGHHTMLCDEAADAIEQLVKERDAAVAIADELADMDYFHNGDFLVMNFILKITKIQKKAKEWRGIQE